LALVGAAVMLVSMNAPAASAKAVFFPEPVANSTLGWAPVGSNGWRRTYFENFSAPLKTSTWGRYDGKSKASSLSSWSRDNVFTSGGQMLINTVNNGGTWTSGGVSSGEGVIRTQGQWLVRAKLDKAPGIGFAFLLYPAGGGWPPEVDFAEGAMGGSRILSTLHYDSDNKRILKYLNDVDLSQWHTYGVIMYKDTLSYTIDGRIWFQLQSYGVPKVPMWMGLQTNAKPCDGVNLECVTAATPRTSSVHIDWAAHYTYVG